MGWRGACEPDTAIGEYKLRAEFMTANGLLEDTLVVRVVEPPKTEERVDDGGARVGRRGGRRAGPARKLRP